MINQNLNEASGSVQGVACGLNLFKCVNYLDAPIHKFHSKVPNKCEFILYILKINCYILLTFTLKNLNITFFMYNRNETEIN